MSSFESMGEFALHLAKMEAAVLIELERGLEKVAKKVEKTAKKDIGNYQEGIGQFPEWQELAESTQADRVAKGYPADAPLLRTGELRDSIGNVTHGLEAEVGSDSDIAVWQELGTNKIPPRPFLGMAVEQNREEITKILGEATVVGLLGGTQRIGGYTMDI